MAEMTSRERVMAALRHEQPDRNPIGTGFGANWPVIVKLQKHFGFENPMQVYGWMYSFSDIAQNFYPFDYVGPKELDGWINYTSQRRTNVFRIVEEMCVYGEGDDQGTYYEFKEHPLANVEDAKELESFPWPKIEWFDFTNTRKMLEQTSQGGTKAVEIGPIGTVFETTWQMLGLTKMYMDLIDNPELVSEVARRVSDVYVQIYNKIFESAGDLVDIVFCGDDLGTQTSIMMSPDTYREVIKPHQAKVFAAIHKAGKKVMYHTDGAVTRLVPDLIDAGVDILEALQFDAADMDPQYLKDNFGDRLCFHGGISVQSTLPFGTVEDVKKEVEARIEVLGKNGGYILAPSHAIQAGTPVENVIAMFETAFNYKRK